MIIDKGASQEHDANNSSVQNVQNALAAAPKIWYQIVCHMSRNNETLNSMLLGREFSSYIAKSTGTSL